MPGVATGGAVTVVGASIAGMHAAHTLRKEGFEGSISVVDASPHLPYDRPPLSKQVLTGEWEPGRIVLPAVEEALELDWHLGRTAVSLDVQARSVTLDDGSVLVADGVVLATGVAARRLPGLPDIGGIHVLRTIDDCLALRTDLDRIGAAAERDAARSRVVVVGAGFIGAEVAASCRKRGLEVTMLEVAEVPLERALGRQVGSLCADLHRRNGVDLRLGAGVAAFLGERTLEAVVLDDGTTIDASVAVVGVGTVVSTGWLEGSGLVLDGGLVCDETLLAAPGVVGAGDMVRWPSRRFGRRLRLEHWENAVQQGEAAGRRLLVDDSEAEPYDPLPWFWSDQYDRKIQLAGMSGPDHDFEVVSGSVEELRFVGLYGREGVTEGVVGFNRPRHVVQLRHLVAERAPWEEALAVARAL